MELNTNGSHQHPNKMNKPPITLATLPEATEQEVFDQVANHLLKQNKQCVTGHGACKYRLKDSELKCAAGALMSDEEYNKHTPDGDMDFNELEIHGEWRILVDSNIVPHNHADLIIRLQAIHDKSLPSAWRTKLESLAHMKHLSIENLLPETDEHTTTTN